MVVDSEARRQRSRENGAKSRGALTPETVSICSRNAIQLGLFARKHCLEDEDPDEIAALREEYLAADRPSDPTTRRLVLEKFEGDLMAQRCHRARTSELRRQQKAGARHWDKERSGVAGELHEALMAPGTVALGPIIASMTEFGHGLAPLIADWARLKGALDARGYLSPEEWSTGLRLMAAKPEVEFMAEHEDVYLFTLWSLCAHPAPQRAMFEALLHPENRPAGLRELSTDALVVDAASAREELVRWVDGELAGLRAIEERVNREVDGPPLADAVHPAALLLDPVKAKRFDRAASEYRSTFHRANNALEARLKRLAAEAKNAPGPDGGRARSSGSPFERQAPKGPSRDYVRGRRRAKNGAAASDPEPGPQETPDERPSSSSDIHPQAWRRMFAPEPVPAPLGATESVSGQRDKVGTRGDESGSQNEPRNGPIAVSGGPPEPRPLDASPACQTDLPHDAVNPFPASGDGWMGAPPEGQAPGVADDPLPGRVREPHPLSPGNGNGALHAPYTDKQLLAMVADYRRNIARQQAEEERDEFL
jgi:hypothetical protein